MRILLALVLAVSSLVRAEDATIALNFQDVEIPVLARFVSEVTGRNFIVDDRVRGKVSIISVDGITAALEAVKAGTLSGTISQYPYAEGQMAVQACIDLAKNKSVPTRIVSPPLTPRGGRGPK